MNMSKEKCTELGFYWPQRMTVKLPDGSTITVEPSTVLTSTENQGSLEQRPSTSRIYNVWHTTEKFIGGMSELDIEKMVHPIRRHCANQHRVLFWCQILSIIVAVVALICVNVIYSTKSLPKPKEGVEVKQWSPEETVKRAETVEAAHKKMYHVASCAALMLVVITAVAFVFGPSNPTVGQKAVFVAIWTMGPPLWFSLELVFYYKLFGEAANPVKLKEYVEVMKNFQEPSRAVWAGVIIFMAFLFWKSESQGGAE